MRVSFEKSGDSLDGMSLTLDTELIRYKWRGADGSFPEYEKLIPDQFNTLTSFDTNEALKAVSSLKVLSDSKSYPIDLTIGNLKVQSTSYKILPLINIFYFKIIKGELFCYGDERIDSEWIGECKKGI